MSAIMVGAEEVAEANSLIERAEDFGSDKKEQSRVEGTVISILSISDPSLKDLPSLVHPWTFLISRGVPFLHTLFPSRTMAIGGEIPWGWRDTLR